MSEYNSENCNRHPNEKPEEDKAQEKKAKNPNQMFQQNYDKIMNKQSHENTVEQIEIYNQG